VEGSRPAAAAWHRLRRGWIRADQVEAVSKAIGRAARARPELIQLAIYLALVLVFLQVPN